MISDLPLTPTLDQGACPHLAVLLRTADELHPVLASFFALGAKRGGFLVHRAMPGTSDEDRRRLAGAGLAVDELERDGRLVIAEFDLDAPPDDVPQRLQEPLHDALRRGCSALWYARFAVGADDETYQRIVPFEDAWNRWFAGQPVITLCPFIVEGLDGGTALTRVGDVARHHDAVLVAGEEGVTMLASPPSGLDAGHPAAR